MLAFAAGGMLMYLPEGITAESEMDITDGRLQQPIEIISSGGELKTTISLAKGNHNTVATKVFTTRLFNGTLPGPTLRLSAGEWLRVLYLNDLTLEEDVNDVLNEFGKPDITNLHWHGPHVTSELPSDNVHLEIEPGGSFQYEVFIPEYHLGGTHWIHPHVHGSTAIQVAGGASLALIINDEPGAVPPEVETAEDIVLVVQNINIEDLIGEIQFISRSTLIEIVAAEGVNDNFRLVNGQYHPELDITTGEWSRLRIVFANWDKKALDFAMETNGICEMNLLAKDGIYIQDYPRPLSNYPIPTAGRADIMIRCKEPGTWVVTHYSGDDLEPLMTITSVLPSGGLPDPFILLPATTDFIFQETSYTLDLVDVKATKDCACTTVLDDDQVNGRSYKKGTYVHTIAQGSIVERFVSGIGSHPYHQHTYPYQIIELGDGMSDKDLAYFKIGDYHDSLMIESLSDIVMRYSASTYEESITIACHRLDHADMGMISAEYIAKASSGGKCNCSARSGSSGFTFPPTTGPTNAPVGDVIVPTNAPILPTPAPIAPVLTTIAPIAPAAPAAPPTCVPHSTPSTHPPAPTDDCFDDPEFYGTRKQKDCEWVAKKPEKRCTQGKQGKSGKNDRAYNYCKKSCKKCPKHVTEK